MEDALIAKNFLSETEIRELNRVTTILLDVFEDQLDIGKLTLMIEAEALLDKQLRSLNRAVLNHGGNVRRIEAEAHAKAQYRLFDERRRALRHARADTDLSALTQSVRSLPKSRSKKKSPSDD